MSYVDPQLLSHPGVQEVQAQARAPSDDLRRHSQKSSERPFFIRVRDGFPLPAKPFSAACPRITEPLRSLRSHSIQPRDMAMCRLDRRRLLSTGKGHLWNVERQRLPPVGLPPLPVAGISSP